QISVYGPELQPEEPTEPEPTTGLPPSITTEIGDSGLEGILEERHPMTGTFRFRFGVESRYDDNLFQYSDRSLQRFNPNTSKYNGLSSADDVIVAVPLRFDYRMRSKWKTRFTLVVDPQFHAHNSARDYQIYYAAVEQKMPHDSEINFRYLLIPHY